MAIKAYRVTVTTTATDLTAGDATLVGVPGNGSSLSLRPAADVYIGAADVTADDGYLVSGGSELAVDLETNERLWAVAASGTVEVSILRASV